MTIGLAGLPTLADVAARVAAQPQSFAGLLGPARWRALPAAIRRRFEAHGAGELRIYAGEIVAARASLVGRLLAQLARLIGAPLPTRCEAPARASVVVTPVPAGGGQIWTRIYCRQRGLPQAIHSIKRFAGPTGLEEYLGCGVGIALRLETDARALTFRSDHYFLQFNGLRLRLPDWFAPGALTIGHIDLDGTQFAFTLDLVHPLLGELIHQRAVFVDHAPAVDDRFAA